MDARGDIETRADCERLVRAFYGRAMRDPIIGFIFTDVAKLDLEAHVPEITSFWETVLLGTQTYRGGAFAPHAALHRRVGLRAGRAGGGAGPPRRAPGRPAAPAAHPRRPVGARPGLARHLPPRAPLGRGR